MALFISFPKFIRIFQKIRPYLFLKTSACFFNFVLPNRNFFRIFSPKHTGENPKTTGPIPVKICSIAILSLSSIAGKDRNEAVPPAGTQDGNRQDRQNPRSKIPGANCRFPAIPNASTMSPAERTDRPAICRIISPASRRPAKTGAA